MYTKERILLGLTKSDKLSKLDNDKLDEFYCTSL